SEVLRGHIAEGLERLQIEHAARADRVHPERADQHAFALFVTVDAGQGVQRAGHQGGLLVAHRDVFLKQFHAILLRGLRRTTGGGPRASGPVVNALTALAQTSCGIWPAACSCSTPRTRPAAPCIRAWSRLSTAGSRPPLARRPRETARP